MPAEIVPDLRSEQKAFDTLLDLELFEKMVESFDFNFSKKDRRKQTAGELTPDKRQNLSQPEIDVKAIEPTSCKFELENLQSILLRGQKIVSGVYR